MRATQKPVTDAIEETLIAAILGIMTLITFANVVVRYVFNSNILWALEATVFLFGWLVLLGTSYAVKKNIHLGVDVLINMLEPRIRRMFGLISVTLCIFFAVLLMKGAWDYWANFANLPGAGSPPALKQSFAAAPGMKLAMCPCPNGCAGWKTSSMRVRNTKKSPS